MINRERAQSLVAQEAVRFDFAQIIPAGAADTSHVGIS
jgi:hypothetical protein